MSKVAYDEKRVMELLSDLEELSDKYNTTFNPKEEQLLLSVRILLKRVHTLLEYGSKVSTAREIRGFLG